MKRFTFASLMLLVAAAASGQAVKTEVWGEPDHARLLRDGKPYFIQGAAGSASAELLHRMGGNSLRTWSTDGLDWQLEQAQRYGLTVTVGIRLEAERNGFDYNRTADVAAQFERARAAVEKYKNHPAVLMWGLGNEMEGYGAGDNAAIWSAIQAIAAMTHKVDPNHPTMTVLAEIGGERVQNVHRLCPDIDIVGINSYGGASSLPKRYRDAGGSKPYVLSEFGPLGPWESPATAHGASLEMTSSQKAEHYRKSYEGGVLGGGTQCFGSYAFLWGHKQEATFTWFSMILEDRTKMQTVSTLNALWTGKPPLHNAPALDPMTVSTDTAAPGQTITASVRASGSSALTYDWQLHEEQTHRLVGNDEEEPTRQFPDAIGDKSGPSVHVTLPTEPGAYRLYCIVRDAENWGASANLPLWVGRVSP